MRALPAFPLLLAAACARPFPPPGGERDATPPRLVSTSPVPLSVIQPRDIPIEFRFDERISERGFSDAVALVSPQDSAVRASRSGNTIRVRMDGGWRPGRVYRVVLLPGVRDLFGNERRDQVELIFSTGAAIDSTALAGIILDRISGAPVPTGIVHAVQRGTGARYTAHSDSSGFYSLRYLPAGEYDISAFDDQNRNRRRDLMEPVDSGHTASFVQPSDTVTHIFNVLIPDTTAPRLESAQAMDSVHVRITLDDHVEAEAIAATQPAQIFAAADSSLVTTAVEMMAARVFEQRQRSDTTAVPAAAPLPGREIVLRLAQPLAPGEYIVLIGPIVNLHGLAGGGSTRFEVAEPPPVPPSPPPDTTGIR